MPTQAVIRNAANSAAGSGQNDTSVTTLLVAEDGYYLGLSSPVVMTAGSQTTVAGKIIASPNSNTGPGVGFTAGYNSLLAVEATGWVSGDTAATFAGNGDVLNFGSIVGSDTGILCGQGNNTIENYGTIRASGAAVQFAGSTPDNSLLNAGTISGSVQVGIGQGGAYSITNSGQIHGAVQLGYGTNTLANSGKITDGYTGGDSVDTISNSGVIAGGIQLGSGANTLSNTAQGVITGGVTGGALVDKVKNYGIIYGDVALGNPYQTNFSNILENYGKIRGAYVGASGVDNITNYGDMTSVTLGVGGDTLTNAAGARILGLTTAASDPAISTQITNAGFMNGIKADTSTNGTLLINNTGLIRGGVETSGMPSSITNSGNVDWIDSGVEGRVHNDWKGVVGNITCGGPFYNFGKVHGYVTIGDGGGSADNSGFIGGTITFGSGDDSYRGHDGFVRYADMGDGNDSFEGGAGSETVTGGLGDDTAELGGGQDKFRASAGNDGNDTLEGGNGADTYSASAASAGFTADLDDQIATGASIGTDFISGFENIVGSGFDDMISGTNGKNDLVGADGADTLDGRAGNDRLNGGAGTDTITGGMGRDQLTGGGDGDTFIYKALGESTTAAAGRDLILDFTSGVDKIDLSAIDAVASASVDQAFAFIGAAAFSGTAGELRYASANGYTVLSGDVNGDKIADFAINLKGALALTATDFVL